MRNMTLLMGSVLLAIPFVTLSVQAAPPVALPVPADPQTNMEAANPLDTPLSGAAEQPTITDISRPPSLEFLMAVRPGYSPRPESSNGRDEAIKQAAWAYGAQGGQAARNFAINDMLRRYAAVNDREFDFRTLVLPVGDGPALLRPPVISEAQMAFALDNNGQTARETRQLYRITRKAQIVSSPPQWRTWLVRSVTPPAPPIDAQRPRTRHEVEIWQGAVARGWAAGERQAVEIFLDDLGSLERDIIGMGRYRVLLKAGKVESPDVAILHRDTQGGHDQLRVDDTEIRIRSQPGLDANKAHWHAGSSQ